MNKNDYINKNGCIIDSLMCMFCKSDRVKWKKVVFYRGVQNIRRPARLGRFLGFGGLGWVTNFFLIAR